MMPLDDLLQALRMRVPILQSPMAGVSTPELAAAVSNAGGLGALGIGAATVAQAADAIAATRELTGAAFNVNVFCHRPARRDAAREAGWCAGLAPLFSAAGAAPPTALQEIYRSFVDDDAALAMLLQTRPAVVSFHFGLPGTAALEALRAAGIILLASVTSRDEAVHATAAGVHALVAQGIEAGGHRGMFDPQARDDRLPTATLVRLLAREGTLPVIAAGGIMDAPGIRAALALGAVAAQMGTAFLLCPESATGAGYRAALGNAAASGTVMTDALSGRPARGLRHRFTDHAQALGSLPRADYPVAYDAAKQLFAACAAAGQQDIGAFWAGQGVTAAQALPAAELMRQWREQLALGQGAC